MTKIAAVLLEFMLLIHRFKILLFKRLAQFLHRYKYQDLISDITLHYYKLKNLAGLALK